MAADTLLILQSSVTKTASFNSTGVDLGTKRHRELTARVIFSAATNASGSNSVTFTVEQSSDNSTYYTVASGAKNVVNLSTTAQTGEIYIPFTPTMQYVRLVATFAGAGSTPTITYQGDTLLGFPG